MMSGREKSALHCTAASMPGTAESKSSQSTIHSYLILLVLMVVILLDWLVSHILSVRPGGSSAAGDLIPQPLGVHTCRHASLSCHNITTYYHHVSSSFSTQPHSIRRPPAHGPTQMRRSSCSIVAAISPISCTRSTAAVLSHANSWPGRTRWWCRAAQAGLARMA